MLSYQQQDPSASSLPIGKIICLARTYAKHAAEMHTTPPAEPLLFLKPVSSVIFNHEQIILPSQSTAVHHEVELGVVIGKPGRAIDEKKAMDHVYGYVLAIDMTARDIQQIAKDHGWPWTIAKGFDTFCPLSPIIPKKNIIDPHALTLSLSVNGVVRQKASTKSLLFSIAYIISFISTIMTLQKGDVILTGTPEGVAEIRDGDTLRASLDGYTTLEHPVIRKPA